MAVLCSAVTGVQSAQSHQFILDEPRLGMHLPPGWGRGFQVHPDSPCHHTMQKAFFKLKLLSVPAGVSITSQTLISQPVSAKFEFPLCKLYQKRVSVRGCEKLCG